MMSMPENLEFDSTMKTMRWCGRTGWRGRRSKVFIWHAIALL